MKADDACGTAREHGGAIEAKGCLAVLAVILTGAFAEAGTARPASVLQQAIARLDMTSFDNSLGPRREKHKRTFEDYGFHVVKSDADKTIISDPDHSWEFVLRLLDGAPGRMKICFEDVARNGGSYHTQNAYLLMPGKSGLLAATPTVDPACPSFSK